MSAGSSLLFCQPPSSFVQPATDTCSSQGRGMIDAAAVHAIVARTTSAQGLPLRLAEPAALSQIAALLAGADLPAAHRARRTHGGTRTGRTTNPTRSDERSRGEVAARSKV